MLSISLFFPLIPCLQKTCNYNLIPILYDSKKEMTGSHVFRRKHLDLQGNQVFCENKLNF